MRYVLGLLLTFAWALWLGGQATLVILIITLFKTDHQTAVRAGPIIFHVFERYRLALAALAMLATVGLLFLRFRKLLLAMLTCFVLAAVGGLISITTVTPKMEELWEQGKAEGPEFHRLHEISSSVYRTEMMLLLAAGVMLPIVLRERRREGEAPAEPLPSVIRGSAGA